MSSKERRRRIRAKAGADSVAKTRRRVVIALLIFVVVAVTTSAPLVLHGLDPETVLDDAADMVVANAADLVDAFVDALVPDELAEAFTATASLGIDPRLVAAVAWVESGFSEDVIRCERDSSAGAQGLMQFLPETARAMGIDPCDPAEAIPGGARYLLENYRTFGVWDLAIAAYNAGPGAVEACGCVPSNGETEYYVPKVNDKWDDYKGSVPAPRLESPRRGGGGNPGGPLGSTERYTEPNITATTQSFLDEAVPLFGQGKWVHCYRSDDDGGDHPLGRACDFVMSEPLNTHPTAEYLEHGWRFACWAIQNAESLDVSYVIWQELIWEDYSHDTEPDRRCDDNRAGDGWTEYDCINPPCNLQSDHYDHVHVSLRS